MNELVLNTNMFPEPISHLIRTERVSVKEVDSGVHLMPVVEDSDSKSNLLGMLKDDDKISVNKFLAIKHASVGAERKMEQLYDFCGSGSDLNMTIDSFLAMTHDEKELTGE